MRGDRPWCFTNLKNGVGLDEVVAFVLQQLPNV
jgi:urease accessory protein